MYKRPPPGLELVFGNMTIDGFAKSLSKFGADFFDFPLTDTFPENLSLYAKYCMKCLQKVGPLFKKLQRNLSNLKEAHERVTSAHRETVSTLGELREEFDKYNTTRQNRDDHFVNLFRESQSLFEAQGIVNSKAVGITCKQNNAQFE